MLANLAIRPSLPAADLDRARQFFAAKLGLTPHHESAFGLLYTCGGTDFSVVPTQDAGRATYSLLTWLSPDLTRDMAALRARGVVFEDFDLPFLKTVEGVMTFEGGDQVAWFKDSEGNLLALAQLR